MPIQIQCSSIVVRNDALDRCLAGGAEEFGEIVQTAMAYSDGFLSQASFMSHIDAEDLAKNLELRGLSRDGEDPDFAMVFEKDKSVDPPCDWLILFEFESRLIATLVGNESRKVIAPVADHDPDSLQHYTQEEVEQHLEFVERKGSIDTYRHRETGKLVYSMRATETDDEIYKRASAFVWKHHRLPGDGPISVEHRPAMTKALEELQGLAARIPDAENVVWTLGAAWFALGNASRAKAALQHAHELAPDNIGILKELGSVVLDQEDFHAAVSVGLKAVTVAPDNIDLLGNLAVGQLLAGETEKASQTIQHALKLDPNDSVNQNVGGIVDDVCKGKRPLPTGLNDMMKPVERPSWWRRILNVLR